MLRRTGSSLLSILLMLLCFAQVANAQAAGDEQSLWDRVLSTRKAFDSAIRTLQVEYTHREWRDGELWSATRKYHRDGHQVGGTDEVTSLQMPPRTWAFDGAVVALRNPDRNTLTLSRPQDPMQKMTLPEPRALAERFSPVEIEKAVEDGWMEIRSVTRIGAGESGSNVVVVEVGFPKTPNETAYEIHFDLDRGALGTLTRDLRYGWGVIESRILAVAGISSEGNTLFYPLKSEELSRMSDGTVRKRAEIVVDERSLRINEPVDERIFTLVPLEGERVWDDDLEVWLQNEPQPVVHTVQPAPIASTQNETTSWSIIGATALVLCAAGAALAFIRRASKPGT